MPTEAKKPQFKAGTEIIHSGYWVDDQGNAWWVNVENRQIIEAKAEDEKG